MRLRSQLSHSNLFRSFPSLRRVRLIFPFPPSAGPDSPSEPLRMAPCFNEFFFFFLSLFDALGIQSLSPFPLCGLSAGLYIPLFPFNSPPSRGRSLWVGSFLSLSFFSPYCDEGEIPAVFSSRKRKRPPLFMEIVLRLSLCFAFFFFFCWVAIYTRFSSPLFFLFSGELIRWSDVRTALFFTLFFLLAKRYRREILFSFFPSPPGMGSNRCRLFLPQPPFPYVRHCSVENTSFLSPPPSVWDGL